MRTKKAVMNAQLPPTPCSQDMRDAVVKLAEREGQSIAEIQRAALSLFLSQSDSQAITKGSDTYPSEEIA